MLSNKSIILTFACILLGVITFFAIIYQSNIIVRAISKDEPDCECPENDQDTFERRKFFDSIPPHNPHTQNYSYINLVKLKNNVTPFIEFQTGGNIWDSIATSMNEEMLLLKDQFDTTGHDQTIQDFYQKALKISYIGRNGAILFRKTQYEDHCFGYWIALSSDSGYTWKKYYTGLSEDYFLRAKYNSPVSLWKDSLTLQFEVARIFTDERTVIHPQIMPIQRTVIEDSLIAFMSIRNLTRDSDNDGLTDLEEQKLWLNPNSKDTDSDGISDSQDSNPRHPPSQSDKTAIYQALLDNDYAEPVLLSKYLKSTERRRAMREKSVSYENETVRIITDDQELSSTHSLTMRIIFLTPQEYLLYNRQFPKSLPRYFLSPMFRCLGTPERYEVDFSKSFHGGSYIILKIGADWIIKPHLRWII